MATQKSAPAPWLQIASAPVSWGIMESCENPAEYPYSRVLDEIAAAGFSGTEHAIESKGVPLPEIAAEIEDEDRDGRETDPDPVQRDERTPEQARALADSSRVETMPTSFTCCWCPQPLILSTPVSAANAATSSQLWQRRRIGPK